MTNKVEPSKYTTLDGKGRNCDDVQKGRITCAKSQTGVLNSAESKETIPQDETTIIGISRAKMQK